MGVGDDLVQSFGLFQRLVLTGIINDHNQIDFRVGDDFTPGFFDGLRGVVGRHDDDDARLRRHEGIISGTTK